MTPQTAEAKMRAAGASEAAIAAFAANYRRLRAGETGLIPDADLTPVPAVPEAADLRASAGRELLDRVAVIKLNGGLGTSMGLGHAKSLIVAKDGLTFLEVTLRQVLALRRRHDARLPLVLMNSFYTREETLAALPDLGQDVPVEFVQSQIPKLRADDLQPVEWPANPVLEWCPPGHGDFYTAIAASGVLDALLERGYEYAFVSNADNLGAVLEPRILEWFARSRTPMLLEVVVGGEGERKGGHLARLSDGTIVVRETAQAPDESFADFAYWRYYSTNNIWLDLRALARELAERAPLELPLIVNRKPVDPADPATPQVIQLETAIGAGISQFEGAGAICVPRTRFAPVKTTDDLLVLRSDAYRVTDDGTVEGPQSQPVVQLDPRYYGRLADFEDRFPCGPPGLRACRRLTVSGDVTFGRDVAVRGEVEIRGAGRPGRIADGTVLDGTTLAVG